MQPQTSPNIFKRRRDELNNNNNNSDVAKKPRMSASSKKSRLHHAKCSPTSAVDELHTSPVSGTIIRDAVTSEGDVVPIHKGESCFHFCDT